MTETRRASAALISVSVYKQSSGKRCSDSVTNTGKSDAVVSHRSDRDAGGTGVTRSLL